MRVYKLTEMLKGNRSCCCAEGTHVPDTFDGRSLKDEWKSFDLYFSSPKEGQDAAAPDFAVGVQPILSARAIMGLRPVLEKYGELLPITCPQGTYMVYNVTTVLDVLDQEKSQCKRFRDGGLMMVDRFAFKDTSIADEELFRIKNFARGKQFCLETFVHRVEDLKLTGFQFTHVGDILLS